MFLPKLITMSVFFPIYIYQSVFLFNRGCHRLMAFGTGAPTHYIGASPPFPGSSRPDKISRPANKEKGYVTKKVGDELCIARLLKRPFWLYKMGRFQSRLNVAAISDKQINLWESGAKFNIKAVELDFLCKLTESNEVNNVVDVVTVDGSRKQS